MPTFLKTTQHANLVRLKSDWLPLKSTGDPEIIIIITAGGISVYGGATQ